MRTVNSETLLNINNATYTYEGETLPVWEHLSCCFLKGRINAITGPSGCGKSSVLYLLNGLIPHMFVGKLEGEVLLDGENVTETLPRYRCERIGYVMQNPESQFCTFTVEEEIAFGMENLGMPVEGMKDRIEEVLEFVGMSGMEKVDLTRLSGGQKQKVAIASIIATKPEILLLDEPTANLDPESRKQVFDLIVRLAKEEGTTIILVEHNLHEIISQVDHVIAMVPGGNLVAEGSPSELEKSGWSCEEKIDLDFFAEDVSTDELVLSVKNLEFAYPVPGAKNKKTNPGRPVLRGIDFDIRKQEFVAIVGDNGVGKTTLIKNILGIEKRDAGSIEILGKAMDSYSKKDLFHTVGMVFQNPEDQFIKNSVYDELMFSLKRVKISDEEKEERINDMLARFSLEKEKEKSPFELSQGQKRRLSVADMLLTNQQILFLDEPTYGQDSENRHELMRDMQNLARNGITIIMITHDLGLVRQYATRVIEIEKGKVIKDLLTRDYFTGNSEKGGAL